MKMSMIAAVDLNGVIGKGNALPWHYPEDMQWFRQHTLDKAILMGRNTFLSLGKALPRRLNIILSSKTTIDQPGGMIGSSLEAIERDILQVHDHDEVVLIGGKQMYETLGAKHADTFILTVINAEHDGDVYLDLPVVNILTECVRNGAPLPAYIGEYRVTPVNVVTTANGTELHNFYLTK